jgi:glycosyltransferase involved in cell wall biosynthesis
MSFSVIIPAFNEGKSIEGVLRELMEYLRSHHPDCEVIVVDDGSDDETAALAENVSGVRLLSHPYNKGYGAAIKTGIRAAKNEWCITYDGDSQHTPDLIPLLLAQCKDPNHMVVGRRERYVGPWIRRPGKWLLQKIANWLTGKRIPDLNSGLRAFHRKEFLKYQHLFPDGFSLSTTSTVCFFRANLNVIYVPIRIRARIGKSTVSASDAPRTLMLIIRLIMLFSPLRIFLPTSIFFALLTILDIFYEFSITGSFTNKSSIALLSLTSLTFFFGLLADQIAAIRRELGKN